MKSRNYNNNFRKVSINGRNYLAWFSYEDSLFLKCKSHLFIEAMYDHLSTSVVVDVPYEGIYDVQERYDFFNKHRELIEQNVQEFDNLLTLIPTKTFN